GLFARSLNWVGQPIELAHKKLPEKARSLIARASKKAIEKALALAVKTVGPSSSSLSFSEASAASRKSGWAHKAAAAAVGGVGGFFGIATLPIELPMATTIILRSIADVAKKYGNDL